MWLDKDIKDIVTIEKDCVHDIAKITERLSFAWEKLANCAMIFARCSANAAGVINKLKIKDR